MRRLFTNYRLSYLHHYLRHVVKCLFQVYTCSKPMKIGYFESDGYQMPSPSMKRGLRETKALLERAGHTVRLTTTLPLESTVSMPLLNAGLTYNNKVYV